MSIGAKIADAIMYDWNQHAENAASDERDKIIEYIERRIDLLSKETKHTYIALAHELRLFAGDLKTNRHHENWTQRK